MEGDGAYVHKQNITKRKFKVETDKGILFRSDLKTTAARILSESILL